VFLSWSHIPTVIVGWNTSRFKTRICNLAAACSDAQSGKVPVVCPALAGP
jgi:hypothetical protein